jgi:UDP-glucose 4-epimerase
MMHAQPTWLITGGAGFIGAHIADKLLSEGVNVVVYDSLRSGLESRINYLRAKHSCQIPLAVGDIRDDIGIEEVLKLYKPGGIIHAAALKSVVDSMHNEEEYMEVNFNSTRNLLDLAERYKIRNFIFSSSAAVYGSPSHDYPAKESDPLNPISPYGRSKLLAEQLVTKFLSDTSNRGSSLRFFNVIGTESSELADNSIENLLPIIISKIASKQPITIFGTDYPTPDGTCVRDYVDVRDIATANYAILNSKNPTPSVINIGTGKGVSVREMIELVQKADNQSQIEVIEADRRPGDAAFLAADVSLAKIALGFSSDYSARESVKSLFQS